MEQIILRSIQGGAIFNDTFFVSGFGASDAAVGKNVEVFYKNTPIGMAEVLQIKRHPDFGLELKYKIRNLTNQEVLLQEWWQNVKTNSQINQDFF
jgi:hypothetical protein